MPRVGEDAVQTPTAPPAPEPKKVEAPPPTLPMAHASVTTVRKVVYPVFDIIVFRKPPRGDGAMTMDHAKHYLGWTEVEGKKGSKLTDHYGKFIIFTNNPRNRRFDLKLAETWEAVMLQGRWKFNGESLIIGETAITISAQHRLAGFILACQKKEKDPAKYPNFDGTLECYFAVGIEEVDDVVDTIDTGKPRGLDDVIYRQIAVMRPDLFGSLDDAARNNVSRIISKAVKNLWDRTDASKMAWAPKIPHSDYLDFLARHEKLLDCCNHIYVEDDGSKISKLYVNAGTASALLYLMGSSTSDGKAYIAAGRTENALDWAQYSMACDFWALIGAGNADFHPVRQAIMGLTDEDGSGTTKERVAVLSKAWALFSQKKPITAKEVDISDLYDEDDGVMVFKSVRAPTFGGIDLGYPDEVSESTTEASTAEPPTTEEIEAKSKAIRDEKARKLMQAREEKAKEKAKEKKAAEANGAPAAPAPTPPAPVAKKPPTPKKKETTPAPPAETTPPAAPKPKRKATTKK